MNLHNVGICTCKSMAVQLGPSTILVDEKFNNEAFTLHIQREPKMSLKHIQALKANGVL